MSMNERLKICQNAEPIDERLSLQTEAQKQELKQCKQNLEAQIELIDRLQKLMKSQPDRKDLKEKFDDIQFNLVSKVEINSCYEHYEQFDLMLKHLLQNVPAHSISDKQHQQKMAKELINKYLKKTR